MFSPAGIITMAPCSHITREMNNRSVGGRSSEIVSPNHNQSINQSINQSLAVGFQTHDIYFLLQMYPDPNTLLRNDNDTAVNENRGRGANIRASYSGGASKAPVLHLIQILRTEFNQNMLRHFGDETFGRTS
jgi:hypothetical protein